MLKTWLFEFFFSPAPRFIKTPDASPGGVTPEAAREQYRVYWERWLKAERYGFEGIFFSEHHFGSGYSPSPNLLIAALAPMTKTLRLGVMGVVLPYYQPWRVIEEMGMLDQLSGGRLEVGTASGIPYEMAQIGLGIPEANARNAEAQEILDQWVADPYKALSYQGQQYSLDNINLVPPLVQSPPPRWTTVVSEASARRSARRGTKIATGFSSIKDVNKVFDGYREDADAVGLHVTSDMLGLRRSVTVDKDGDRAREIADFSRSRFRKIADHAQESVTRNLLPDAPPPPGVAGGLGVSDEDYIAGTPAEVAEQIIEQCRATRAGHFMATTEAYPSVDDMNNAYDLFGTEVLPVLNRAGLP